MDTLKCLQQRGHTRRQAMMERSWILPRIARRVARRCFTGTTNLRASGQSGYIDKLRTLLPAVPP